LFSSARRNGPGSRPQKSNTSYQQITFDQIREEYAIGIQHDLLLSKTICQRLVASDKQRQKQVVELLASQPKELFVYSYGSEPTFARMAVKD